MAEYDNAIERVDPPPRNETSASSCRSIRRSPSRGVVVDPDNDDESADGNGAEPGSP